MADFNPINIPPKGIGPVETAKPGKAPAVKPDAGQPDFKDALLKTLGQMSENTSQIANTAIPGIQNVDQAMNAAKGVFEDTMNAHRMMQQLIQDIEPQDETGEDQDREEQDEK